MEIILKEEIRGLGKALELVKVKNGYAHNYLFPRSLAVLATAGARKQLEQERHLTEERLKQEKAQWQAVADKLQNVSVTIASRVAEGEKLYGSVTAQDISNKLRETGRDIDKKNVLLAEPIKQLGMYTVRIQLHRDVEAKIKLWVISDESK
jgi:large subunit ribosomal protein L9